MCAGVHHQLDKVKSALQSAILVPIYILLNSANTQEARAGTLCETLCLQSTALDSFMDGDFYIFINAVTVVCACLCVHRQGCE